MTLDAALSKRSGLSVLRDIILAPQAAFTELASRTHWGWAFVVICVLGCVGAVLQIPAGEHIATATILQNAAHDPNLAGMSPEKQQQTIKLVTRIQDYVWAFYPFIAVVAIAVTALVLKIGSTAGRGEASFGRLFGLAANVAVLNYGIGYLLIGALTRLRGADAYSSSRDLVNTLPSLAWLVPGGSAKLVTFLAQFNPLQIWSLVLFALGLTIVAKVPRGVAYAIATVVTLGGAIFQVPFAK
jgi:hypothetical protein